MTTTTRQKLTALFGGSFNPPHVAHVLIVGWALAVGDADEVWIIPTGGHPFGKSLAPFDHRMEMIRLAFACYGERVRVLDIEREERVHYSVETVKALARRYPDRSWRWIIGSDAIEQIDQWRDFETLSRIAPPMVIGREGHGPGAEGSPASVATKIDTPALTLPDISSTLIRKLLAKDAEDERLRALLPGNVLRYIRRHGLYRDSAE